jgi:heme oxygenase-like protein
LRAALQDVRAPLTPSARFRGKLELVIGPYSEACARLVDDPRLRELWPEYLVVQHQIIRATVPLTRVALDEAKALGDDPAGLADYLELHVDEELGHDETLLDDLELLGLARGQVLARMPSPAVASLVGAQYYWILHHHPVAFLGYVGVMEGYPPADELVELLIERTGFPREAFGTFAEHGELDPGHRDHLDRTLDALPLTPEHEAAIGVSALATLPLATRVLAELLGEA